MRSSVLVTGVVATLVCLYGAISFFSGIWPFSTTPVQSAEEPEYVAEYIDSVADMHRAFPTDADVVFVGDSRVQIPQWSDMFPNASVANRGIGSDTLYGLLKRVDHLGIRSPNVVVLQMGANDVLLKHPLADASAAASQIFERLERQAGRLIVLEIIDCRVDNCDRQQLAALNVHMRILAQKYDVQFIELNSKLADSQGIKPAYSHDGLHLNAEGYQELVSILCGQIPELACAPGQKPAAPAAGPAAGAEPKAEQPAPKAVP